MPGWHCETWARGLFIVWSSPTNFASHFHSVPFSSELYRASFKALALTMMGPKLPKKMERASCCPPRPFYSSEISKLSEILYNILNWCHPCFPVVQLTGLQYAVMLCSLYSRRCVSLALHRAVLQYFFIQWRPGRWRETRLGSWDCCKKLDIKFKNFTCLLKVALSLEFW